MAYYNMDSSILNWYSTEGKNLDFDYLIYYEYDIFTSKTINELYSKYTKFDAAFVNYAKANTTLYWYVNPHGGKKAIRKWLKNKRKPTTLYRGLFSANMVSREILTKLASTQLPHGYCELRFPSIITNLGFSCTKLDFPMLRFRPYLTKTDIKPNWTKGIFHPVLENIDE